MAWYYILLICLLALAFLLTISACFYKCFFKRFYDIFLSGFAIIVLSPLFLVLIILGSIKMKGNPFFYQLRPGKIDKKTGEERIFKLIKFRTMTCEKDESGNLLPDEKRLNKYGKALRAMSFDELPELFNIFKGDMTIIGPRPQLVRDMVFMSESQRKRHSVKPGLSGLAQVNGRNNITWEQKFLFDLEYIEKMSFFCDIMLIIKTVFKVFKRADVVREGTSSDMDFGDWLMKEGKITLEEYNAKQKTAKEILDANK